MPSLARVGVCAGWAELPTHARGDTPAHEELGRKNYQGDPHVATAAGGNPLEDTIDLPTCCNGVLPSPFVSLSLSLSLSVALSSHLWLPLCLSLIYLIALAPSYRVKK